MCACVCRGREAPGSPPCLFHCSTVHLVLVCSSIPSALSVKTVLSRSMLSSLTYVCACVQGTCLGIMFIEHKKAVCVERKGFSFSFQAFIRSGGISGEGVQIRRDCVK